MALTDAKARSAKPKTGATITKFSDGGGLQLCVMPTGGKLWRLAYRFKGKERTLSIGGYPAVGIADARRVRDDSRVLLARGIDPNAQRRADKTGKTNGDALTFDLDIELAYPDATLAQTPQTAE